MGRARVQMDPLHAVMDVPCGPAKDHRVPRLKAQAVYGAVQVELAVRAQAPRVAEQKVARLPEGKGHHRLVGEAVVGRVVLVPEDFGLHSVAVGVMHGQHVRCVHGRQCPVADACHANHVRAEAREEGGKVANGIVHAPPPGVRRRVGLPTLRIARSKGRFPPETARWRLPPARHQCPRRAHLCLRGERAPDDDNARADTRHLTPWVQGRDFYFRKVILGSRGCQILCSVAGTLVEWVIVHAGPFHEAFVRGRARDSRRRAGLHCYTAGEWRRCWP
mmetsp:Transcript_25122/g.68120  ORF Transcript_25122/g.68120 Transcript_25122/m.68120 type:complete len:276 (+) Transcript_25122:575-1402(+)